MPRNTDMDHLIWTGPQWEHSKDGQRLRRQPTLIRELDRETHEAKHRETPPVPLLGHYALARTLKFYQPHQEPLGAIDNLQHAIELAANHPKAHEIEKHLAELAIWTLDLARPYWAESPEQPRPTIIDLSTHRAQRKINQVADLQAQLPSNVIDISTRRPI